MRKYMTGAGRYKLIRRLDAAEGYDAYAALDIETSERRDVLLNIYAGQDAIRRMVRLYYGMDGGVCRDFLGMYTEDGRFTAVFALNAGEAFDAVFSKRGGAEEALRQELCESLLHAALENAAMPEALLCAMLREENVVVLRDRAAVRLNACIPPLTREQEACRAPLALSPLLERVLLRRWSALDAQIDFLDAVAAGRHETVGQVYSAWRLLLPEMVKDRKGGALGKVFRFLRRSFRRWKKRRQEIRRARKAKYENL